MNADNTATINFLEDTIEIQITQCPVCGGILPVGGTQHQCENLDEDPDFEDLPDLIPAADFETPVDFVQLLSIANSEGSTAPAA